MKPPTKSQQQYFGVAVFSALLMLAWITWRAFAYVPLSGIFCVCGITFAGVYYCVPSAQPKLITIFRTITYPVQWIMTLVVLGIVYYAVLTPVAIWYRLAGKSICSTDTDTETNWQPIEQSPDRESYFRTF